MNRKLYSPDWPKIRRAILKRDGYCCQHCEAMRYAVGFYVRPQGFSPIGGNAYLDQVGTMGAKTFKEAQHICTHHREVSPEIKYQVVVLAVAHLDQDRDNNEDTNLLSLCQRCHFAYDRHYNVPKLLTLRKYGRNYRKIQYELPFF